MTTTHDQRWSKLKAALNANQTPTDGRQAMATITQEITEMTQDVDQLVTVLKAHKETIEGQGQKQTEFGARLHEIGRAHV